MAGISKIKIPIKKDKLTVDEILKYLPAVYSEFSSNSTKIRKNYDSYCLKHEILNKVRLHDEEVNNIVLSPHIRSMVDWKTGYTLGNPIKYAQSKSAQTDDITVLNTYLRSSNKRAIDAEVAKWVYSCGVGYYFVQPNGNSIAGFAPFDIFCVDADACCKVYSSYLGNEPLFDLIKTTIEEKTSTGGVTERIILSVYTPAYMFEFSTTISETKFELTKTEKRPLYAYLPLVEKRYNQDGIGIAEMASSLQTAIDSLASDSLDNVEDIVNELWIFFNVSLGGDDTEKSANFKQMKKLGAIELNSSSPEFPADVKKVSTKLELMDVMQVRNILLREMYDTNGVPIASSNISSGNVTKGGGEVANGYENAYNRALDDINNFIKADYEVLDRIVYICKTTAGTKINELNANEIEIKYCLNMSDNMLTKSQSYVNFVEQGMPPAMALEKTKISNDSEAEGLLIEEYIAKKAKQVDKNNTKDGNV